MDTVIKQIVSIIHSLEEKRALSFFRLRLVSLEEKQLELLKNIDEENILSLETFLLSKPIVHWSSMEIVKSIRSFIVKGVQRKRNSYRAYLRSRTFRSLVVILFKLNAGSMKSFLPYDRKIVNYFIFNIALQSKMFYTYLIRLFIIRRSPYFFKLRRKSQRFYTKMLIKLMKPYMYYKKELRRYLANTIMSENNDDNSVLFNFLDVIEKNNYTTHVLEKFKDSGQLSLLLTVENEFNRSIAIYCLEWLNKLEQNRYIGVGKIGLLSRNLVRNLKNAAAIVRNIGFAIDQKEENTLQLEHDQFDEKSVHASVELEQPIFNKSIQLDEQKKRKKDLIRHFLNILTNECVRYFLEHIFKRLFNLTIAVELNYGLSYLFYNPTLRLEYTALRVIAEDEIEEEMDEDLINFETGFHSLYFCIIFKNIYFFSGFLFHSLTEKRFHSAIFSEIVSLLDYVIALANDDDVGYRFLLKGKFDRHGRKKYRRIEYGTIKATSLTMIPQFTSYHFDSKYGVFSIRFWFV